MHMQRIQQSDSEMTTLHYIISMTYSCRGSWWGRQESEMLRFAQGTLLGK